MTLNDFCRLAYSRGYDYDGDRRIGRKPFLRFRVKDNATMRKLCELAQDNGLQTISGLRTCNCAPELAYNFVLVGRKNK